jgi:hypothetical protein
MGLAFASGQEDHDGAAKGAAGLGVEGLVLALILSIKIS